MPNPYKIPWLTEDQIAKAYKKTYGKEFSDQTPEERQRFRSVAGRFTDPGVFAHGVKLDEKGNVVDDDIRKVRKETLLMGYDSHYKRTGNEAALEHYLRVLKMPLEDFDYEKPNPELEAAVERGNRERREYEELTRKNAEALKK